MKKYRWKGLLPSGHIQHGSIFANNKSLAIKKLTFQKITPLKIKRSYFNTSPHKIDFYTKLHSMLTSNVPIIDALSLLKIHGDIIEKLRLGGSLSESISSSMASPVERKIIQIGEDSQKLNECLLVIIKRLKAKQALKRKMKQSSTYPMILLSVSMISIFIMLNWVVPQFSQIFSLYNAQLPPITQNLINISHATKKYAPCILVISISLFYIMKIKFPKIHSKLFDFIQTKMPFVKSIHTAQTKSSWFLFLSLCLDAHIDLIESLKMSTTVIKSQTIKNKLNTCVINVKKGQSLHDSLKSSGLFTDEEIYKIHIGEKTNELSRAIVHLSQDLEKINQEKIEILKQWIEPATLIFISILMGFILVAMYVPIFQIGNVL